jgi:hypothetical protein
MAIFISSVSYFCINSLQYSKDNLIMELNRLVKRWEVIQFCILTHLVRVTNMEPCCVRFLKQNCDMQHVVTGILVLTMWCTLINWLASELLGQAIWKNALCNGFQTMTLPYYCSCLSDMKRWNCRSSTPGNVPNKIPPFVSFSYRTGTRDDLLPWRLQPWYLGRPFLCSVHYLPEEGILWTAGTEYQDHEN